jgi:phage terminase large subunit GpA-like protein
LRMWVRPIWPRSPPLRLELLVSAAVLAVKRRSIEMLRPPPPLKVSEWAKAHRSLSRKDSARPGRWRSEPHQDGIMDARCDPRVRRVVVMAASQVVGESQMMNNVIGRFIDVDPSNMLVMMLETLGACSPDRRKLGTTSLKVRQSPTRTRLSACDPRC